MKENLSKSLDFCLRTRKAIETMIEILERQIKANPNFSDELQQFIDVTWEDLENINVLLDEVIVTLNERQQIFGNEGIEKELTFEEEQ